MKKNSGIVLFTLNSRYIHSSLAPWCLLSGIRVYCGGNIDACVVEGTINEKLEDAALRIAEKCPQFIGFSCYIWNIGATFELIKMVKSYLPDAILILGGPEVSYNAGTVLQDNPLVDYVISGEGEQPLALLLNALIHEENVKNVPGVCCRKDGQIIVSAPYIAQGDPPSPYTSEYYDKLVGRISYIETSRGCPYSCAFCLSGRCGGVRYYDMERIKKEIMLLANSGTKTIKFVDRTFNSNRKRAIELFDYIIKNYGTKIPRGVCFHFEIAGDILDEETMNLLCAAPLGAVQLEVGLQTFNAETLKSIHREMNIVCLTNNIQRMIIKGNIHIHIDLIAGLPYEDWSSFADSFNAAYALFPHMLQLGFLKLLQGSPMREQPESFPCEHSKLPPYEVIQTPWITSGELATLHLLENALNRIYNSGRFRRTLNYLMEHGGYTPFELFYRFGVDVSAYAAHDIPLDDYTALLFEYFAQRSGIDRITLRDAMVCDYLSANASGTLPKVLQIKDTKLKRIKIKLDNDVSTRRRKGVRRGLALLYSEPCAVYADYQNKNPVTGEYRLEKYYFDNDYQL